MYWPLALNGLCLRMVCISHLWPREFVVSMVLFYPILETANSLVSDTCVHRVFQNFFGIFSLQSPRPNLTIELIRCFGEIL